MAVHSVLYYVFDSPVWDDVKYDACARELVQLQQEFPEESKQAPFHKEFEDFIGTGYNLPWVPGLQWAHGVAERLTNKHY